MKFSDINPMSLPVNARYYHNVTVFCLKGEIDLDYWDISHINNARPFAVHCYPQATRAERFDHCVVEVDPRLGVGFYKD